MNSGTGGLTLRFAGPGLEVISVAGRTQAGKIGLMILTAWMVPSVPDMDFALLPVLHHRSILTHSILPALVFLILGRSFGAAHEHDRGEDNGSDTR